MKKTRKIRLTAVFIGALAIGLTGLVYANYRRDLESARCHSSAGSQIVNTPCGLIEYADVGSGPVIFTVHGAGGGFDQSLDLARDFLDAGFRVVAPSRFGYLKTPLPADASPAAQADAHACLLDALKLQKVTVIGGSMGAPSAMQLCLRHPDRCSALILLFPIAFAPHPANEKPRKPSPVATFVMDTTLRSDFVFWATSRIARDTMMKTIAATPPVDFNNAARDEQERVLRTLRNILPISARQNGLRSDAMTAPSVPRYELERFTVPVLVISAENDLFGTFASGRYTAEHIPGARFVGYPTGGHLLIGRKDEVRTEISGFLELHRGADNSPRQGD